ncbi:MAG: Uma2 family endonuclease [Chloroflexi bacterium]|nr:Uma2 family endonuclease [Chloroflexota bacterium]
MEVKKRLYTVDDVLELQGWDGKRDRKYELINGDLIEMSPTNYPHGRLAGRLFRYFEDYAESRNLGEASVEAGFHPANDRSTLLAPDVAFITRARLPDPESFTLVGFMPDLAVEIKSPSNTMAELRRKSTIYLENGAQLVWLIDPMKRIAEICRLGESGQLQTRTVGPDGKLSGEDLLPGFVLELRHLFGRRST